MIVLRAGLAGIVLAVAATTTARAQPYYPRYGPAYALSDRGYPHPPYGYPGYPAYWGPAPFYRWAPSAYPVPYPFFAPYSAGVGPAVDGNTHF